MKLKNISDYKTKNTKHAVKRKAKLLIRRRRNPNLAPGQSATINK